MSNLDHKYNKLSVPDGVEDAVDSDSDSISVDVPRALLQPGGRGSSARRRILVTTRRRSVLVAMASISLTADGLIRTSNLATPLQIFHDGFKREVFFEGSFLEGGEILCIFG